MNENVEYIASYDAQKNMLSGEKDYLLQFPPNIPAKKFWSVIVYDTQTNLIIKNNQSWPSVFSSSKSLVVNRDGSLDIRFGPQLPSGKKKNWIQTIPERGWILILRLYGASESWFDQTWKPGELEVI